MKIENAYVSSIIRLFHIKKLMRDIQLDKLMSKVDFIC